MKEKKILFIDDDESQRKMINNIIKMFGYAIKTASDSGEAMQILENEKYPLIITGLKMPGIDGMALCKRIRETDSESVIYALSGHAAEFKPEKFAQ
ncbi:MAG: response regulator [Deltaproteobacteria bacterium]|nr:response regulator [Deltaproteobacteria bacterium]